MILKFERKCWVVSYWSQVKARGYGQKNVHFEADLHGRVGLISFIHMHTVT